MRLGQKRKMFSLGEEGPLLDFEVVIDPLALPLEESRTSCPFTRGDFLVRVLILPSLSSLLLPGTLCGLQDCQPVALSYRGSKLEIICSQASERVLGSDREKEKSRQQCMPAKN